jgi:hypothetical protein
VAWWLSPVAASCDDVALPGRPDPVEWPPSTTRCGERRDLVTMLVTPTTRDGEWREQAIAVRGRAGERPQALRIAE